MVRILHIGSEIRHELGCAASLTLHSCDVTYFHVGEGNLPYSKRLVCVEVSPGKIRKAKRLNLYDELHIADIRKFNLKAKFDTLIGLEILHSFPADILTHIESLVKEGAP